MPKETKREYDAANREYYGREVGQDEDALVKGKAQDASGLGSKVTGTAFKPPKMNAGESSSAYAARVASARREFEAAKVAGQKKALGGMPKD